MAQASNAWTCLKNRHVPLKFAYAGDSARTHDRLAQRNSYQSVSGDVTLEAATLDSSIGIRNLPPNLCEIGPGNGIHSSLLLLKFIQAGYLPDRILWIDFSARLLAIATSRIRNPEIKRRVTTGTWDVEASGTSIIRAWRPKGSYALILFTGQTLGNVDSPGSVLRNLAHSARRGDKLLLGIALAGSKSPDEELATYQNPVFTRAAIQPLLTLGIPRKAGTFVLSYVPHPETIVGTFVLKRGVTLRRNGAVEVINSGESIECFVSRRFRLRRLLSLLRDSGWVPFNSATDPKRSHAVILCSRR